MTTVLYVWVGRVCVWGVGMGMRMRMGMGMRRGGGEEGR